MDAPIVAIPSTRKSQRQPAMPWAPSSRAVMAPATIPPKAPEIMPALRKMMKRFDCSCRLLFLGIESQFTSSRKQTRKERMTYYHEDIMNKMAGYSRRLTMRRFETKSAIRLTLKPASMMPRRNRIARSCFVVLIAARQAATVPQRNMSNGI